MVALLRETDEHQPRRRTATFFAPLSVEERAYLEGRRAAERRDDEDASGITRDIIRVSAVVCLGVLALLGWVAWLYMR